jgi:hypothetical protein
MSSTRNSLFKKVDSSDYITFKKQSAISIENSAPIKNNGLKYNRNFSFIPASIDASSCLVYAQSYDLKNDYITGQENTKIICEN